MIFGRKKWIHTYEYTFLKIRDGYQEYRKSLSGTIDAQSIGEALKKLAKRCASDKKLTENFEAFDRIMIERTGDSMRRS